MKSNLFVRIVVGLTLIGTTACIKDPAAQNSTPISSNTARVAVLCEGNFMWNNAQLDIYNPDSNALWSNAFEAVNNRPIGDVLQSGIVYGNTLWLVVNNSGKLVSLDIHTLKLKSQINISKSPRYAFPFKGSLYVTDLESNAITILDTLNLSKRILPVLPNPSGVRSGWTEQITQFNNQIVAAVYDGFLWIYNPQTDSTRLIKTEKGTQFLSVDARKQLWVGAQDNDISILTCFDENFQVKERIQFPQGENITRMCGSITGDSLWLLVGGALECRNLRSPRVAIKKVVPYTTGYGLGVNPYNGDVYVSDAYDYIRKGRVVGLNAGGDSIKYSFFSGIIPASFVFLPR